MSEKLLSVAAIENGTVIDHIPAGQAFKIIRLLKLPKLKFTVTVGFNLPSKSFSFKDLIKIENKAITEEEVNQIALFAPEATINIIDGYKVFKKYKVKLPETIEKVLICPNPRCISKNEQINSFFSIKNYGKKMQFHCQFCDKIFNEQQIEIFGEE